MINLYTSYYHTHDKLKNEEMITCLTKNCENEFIDKIYLLNETDVIFTDTKIFNIEIFSPRPTYNIFFSVINRKTPKDINIVANSDIYFDETIQLINNLPEDECYALSRYDNGKHIGYDFSQDVWIFNGKIKDINGDFVLGIELCDGKIAYEIKEAGYFIDNPSLSIKCHHLHKSSREWEHAGIKCLPPYVSIKASHQFIPRKDNSYQKDE